MFLRLGPTAKSLYLPIETHHIQGITTMFDNAHTKVVGYCDNMALSSKTLAGSGYIILNCIRGLNIIGLLAVMSASVIMLVKTSTSSKFFFFDAVSNVITAFVCAFLLVSELSLFRSYFARNWPLLSQGHGFVALALAMIALGVDVLANLNKQPTSQEALGLPFWRIVVASGIIAFVLGFINLVASYVFCDRAQGITARQVRAKGAVAIRRGPVTVKRTTSSASGPVTSYVASPESPAKSSDPIHVFTTERRPSLLPSYHSFSTLSSPAKEPQSPTSRYSRASNCTKKKVFGVLGRARQSLAPPLPINTREPQISGPVGVNPQFAHLVQRPESVLHPSRTGEGDPVRWKALS
ncbi:hypothetical protein KC332_g5352 [Hortaea werneckii]|nr:hypothetical protein KC358_g4896 [Hortaea werneckii]KAI6842900.1 hypothetical protein KC342_g1302 [Hortaea werneckii]KAI6846601.1 hypothetical protein KC350_g3853 [Hortaea werneckii]KAI6938936.1 hypothetical protein KC341_g4544 [Hortaea werneckii]KAI6940446.1 hypothetical protein KC348_g4989 [Hortaea werneckii]